MGTNYTYVESRLRPSARTKHPWNSVPLQFDDITTTRGCRGRYWKLLTHREETQDERDNILSSGLACPRDARQMTRH
jgi:hypothetical protein